jgi:large subunit ribosomal protein L18
MSNTVNEKRQKRKQRVRYSLKKTRNDKLRLSVFVSNKNLYAQLIDDLKGETLVSSSSYKMKGNIINVETAKKVAVEMFDNAKKAGIDKIAKERGVKFDRGSHLYHGKIKAFADEARTQGFNF